jgi:hypothetical protein
MEFKFLRSLGEKCTIHEHDIEPDGGNGSGDFGPKLFKFLNQNTLKYKHGDIIIPNDDLRYRNYFDCVIVQKPDGSLDIDQPTNEDPSNLENFVSVGATRLIGDPVAFYSDNDQVRDSIEYLHIDPKFYSLEHLQSVCDSRIKILYNVHDSGFYLQHPQTSFQGNCFELNQDTPVKYFSLEKK